MSIADSCCCCNTDVRKAVPKTPLCIWCEFGSFRQTSHCFNVLIQSISLWLVGSVVEIYCPNFSFNPNWLTTQPELNYFGIRGFFICEETALEVLMYVCLSIRIQVEILAYMKVPEGSWRFREGSGKATESFRVF